MPTAELLLDCRNIHGEGALWDGLSQRLWWTDIHGKKLWSLDPKTGAASSHAMPARVCCFAPRARGGFLFAFAEGFALYDLESGVRRDLAPFEPNLPGTRLNDGRTDRAGRFVAGGMDEGSCQPVSSVWRVDPDLKAAPLFGGVACANATCFSPDGRTMYFADSPTRKLEAIAYDPATGTTGARRLLGEIEGPGVPDGACVDAQGFVWVAIWEGYRVERWSPGGRRDLVVDVPVKKPTCCTFGGKDLEVLYVTSSRLGSSEAELLKEPTSGGLFALRPGVRGLPDSPFAG
ncbi:MAG TPA: SMP-30/gluconolactonase/LRE family protein [Anaeromyxobacter sp.]|nr:SMP-30/gluconolactonase/LRE family protein [Anaeromyxobacter sp.]